MRDMSRWLLDLFVVSLQDALGQRIAFYMTHTRHLAQLVQQRIADADRSGAGSLLRHEVLYLDMAAETYNLVADGMLETEYDANSDNHHRHTDGYTQGGDAYGRTADLTTSVFSAIDTAGYE